MANYEDGRFYGDDEWNDNRHYGRDTERKRNQWQEQRSNDQYGDYDRWNDNSNQERWRDNSHQNRESGRPYQRQDQRNHSGRRWNDRGSENSYSGNYSRNEDQNRVDYRHRLEYDNNSADRFERYNRNYGRGEDNERGWNENYRRGYPRNRYGGDMRNYGNANQGGFDRGWWDKAKDEVASWFGDEDAERRRDRDQRHAESHRGKGPKGYKRSTERIKEDISDLFSDDPYLDASDIEIDVTDDNIVLTGTVAHRQQKRRAEDLAESVSGVQNVENRIKVAGFQSTSGDHSETKDITV